MFADRMNDAFAEFDRDEAYAFIEGFDRATRRRGQRHFQMGAVTMLKAIPDGFEAIVEGDYDSTVTLLWDPSDGWLGECTCPEGIDCEHVYAAMQAVLAEHSVAAVRSLRPKALPGKSRPRWAGGWTGARSSSCAS